MKTFTKHIITNALLLWAFSPVSLANAIRFDDPKLVTLSDGRRVPFGQGVICSDKCVQSGAETLPDSSKRRQWLWLLIPAALTGFILIPNDPPTITTTRATTPDLPMPTPRRDVPTRTEVPDRNTLEMLGLGLLMCWGAIRLGGNHNASQTN